MLSSVVAGNRKELTISFSEKEKIIIMMKECLWNPSEGNPRAVNRHEHGFKSCRTRAVPLCLSSFILVDFSVPLFSFFLSPCSRKGHPAASEFIDFSTFETIPERRESLCPKSKYVGGKLIVSVLSGVHTGPVTQSMAHESATLVSSGTLLEVWTLGPPRPTEAGPPCL